MSTKQSTTNAKTDILQEFISLFNNLSPTGQDESLKRLRAYAKPAEHRPAVVWPKGFKFPKMPNETNEALDEIFMGIIRDYLPPVWVSVIVDWGIMYADHENGPADICGFIDDFGKLQEYLAGVRRDEDGEGHITKFVRPARKQPKPTARK